jgi:outer membrane protein assembly factor BamB
MIIPLVLAIAGGCDWAQAGFNGANTGSQTFNTAFTPDTVGTLHVAWSRPKPGSFAAQLAVVGDTVFVSSGPQPVFAPVTSGILGASSTEISTTTSTSTTLPPDPPIPPLFEALDAQDGSFRWSAGGEDIVQTPDHGQCTTVTGAGSPLVSARVIYGFSTQTSCTDDSFTPTGSWSTRDAATGAVVATHADRVLVHDAVGDSHGVYVTEGSAADASRHSQNAVVGTDGFRFDAPTGTWLGGAAIDRSTLFVVDSSGTLHAVDRATGETRWTGPAGTGSSDVTPSVGDGMVFVSTRSHLMAFDASGTRGCTTTGGSITCAPVWDDSIPAPGGPGGASTTAPAVSAHRLFVREDWMLEVYDTDTGNLLWQAQLSPATDTVDDGASPTVAGSIVFVGTAGGELQAYDVAGARGCATTTGLTTCTPVWSATLPGAATLSRPVVVGDAVYIASGSGNAVSVPSAAGDGDGSTGDNDTITKFVLSDPTS